MENADAEGHRQHRAMRKLARALDQFRQLEPTLPGQAIVAFLAIARKPGCSTSEVAEALGLSQASSSRNVGLLLKEFVRHGKPSKGLDLVEQRIDPLNRRLRQITLTPKGKRLVNALIDIIEK